MNRKADSIRQEISRYFSNRTSSKAVAIPADQRYSSSELHDVPENAVFCSDGCGNPLLYTNIRPDEVVVDLGAGAGLDVILAARRTGPNGTVIGIDMTDSMVKLARDNSQNAGYKNIEIRKALIESLPVESQSVDWVISNCVINLSPEKDKVFGEVYRVLKPGGSMVISDIVINQVPSWFRSLTSLISGSVTALMDEKSYLATLGSSGLTAIEIKDRTVFSGSRLHKMLLADVGKCQKSEKAKRWGFLAVIERIYLFPILFFAEKILTGKISSIKVFAQRPTEV